MARTRHGNEGAPLKRRAARRVGARRTRKQKGGSKKKFMAYYTCFFGRSGSASDKIPPIPSTSNDCFFFTNNKRAADQAEDAGWNVVMSPVNIKGSDRNNAMDSKELKTCPHHFKQLRGYTYTCYFDSKMKIKESDIINMISGLLGNTVMLLNKHHFIENSVWKELSEAMFQPRYVEDKDKYEAYINSNIKDNNFKDTSDVHYETGLILRKSGEEVDKIGEEWFADIMKTGPECQITFFFIQQKYKDIIKPLPVYYGRDE